MPIDPKALLAAVESGLSIVCASCERYWEARDKGLPGSQCTAPRPCGSPIVGDTFSEYRGAMTTFDRWCFVCGKQPKYMVTVPQHVRRFGICEEHVKLLAELRPIDRLEDVPPPIEVHGKEGTQRRDQIIKPYKSLARAIYEVEKYYADKEGRELK